MADTWFVCIDPVDKGKSVAYLESVDFRIQVQPSDPNYKTLQSGGVINWNGQNLIKWQGPFATEAQAQKAQNPKPSPENPAAPVIQGVTNSVPGLSQIGTFFSSLGQANTWIRVGEVLLGFILIAVGLARITHAVPIATKVATAVGTKGLL